MKTLVVAFNQEKALVGVFSVIVENSRRFVASTIYIGRRINLANSRWQKMWREIIHFNSCVCYNGHFNSAAPNLILMLTLCGTKIEPFKAQIFAY